MFQKIKDKIQNKKGMSTIEFVICMLIFIMVTAFIIDLFIVSYKHYVISANCTKAARVIAIQGGLSNDCPENYPGGNPNYMTNKEFRAYLNELANTVQGDPGAMKVYLSYSYIDNYDNVIEKNDILVYKMEHSKTGAISTTYYPQDFLIPYGSFITLKIEYSYQFFYTDIWFETERYQTFHSSKSYVTEYVSYDYAYHINGQPILVIMQNLPTIDTTVGSEGTATKGEYFTYSGNTITGLSEKGLAADIRDLVIPTEIDGQRISQIAENAFKDNTKLISLIIPNNIKVIRSGAFSGCTNLITVKYYEGLERIDSSAFEGCTKLELFGPAYSYTDANVQAGIETPPRIILPSSLIELNSRGFANCPKIKIVRVGSKTVNIAEDAFNDGNVAFVYLEKEEDTILNAPWRNDLEPEELTYITVTWNAVRVK